MMTEEEAKTKWCPHSRVADADNQSASNNRYVMHDGTLVGHHSYNCLGSACMAWRQTHKKGDFVPTEIVRDLHGEKITYKMAEDGAGFCGLAGNP